MNDGRKNIDAELNRRMTALVDDGRKLLANSHKLTATSRKFLSSNGFDTSAQIVLCEQFRFGLNLRS
jgi:hypothetical protein